MAKQIKNRREDLYIDNVPPVIPDGIVTNINYASASTAGVLKISASYGVAVASTGNLTGSARTAEQYVSAPGTLIISKGTLENVIASIITKMFAAEADPSGEAEDGTKWNFTLLKQTDDYIWLIEQINP